MCAHTANQQKHFDYVIHTYSTSYAINKHNTKDVQGQGPSNLNRNLFGSFPFSFLVGSLTFCYHFPLLTMVRARDMKYSRITGTQSSNLFLVCILNVE